MDYWFLRLARRPLRAAKIAAVLGQLVPLALLPVALFDTARHGWTPRYDAPVPTFACLGLVVLTALYGTVAPGQFLRSFRNIPDVPHDIAAALGSAFLIGASLAMAPGVYGFVGFFVVQDMRFFLVCWLLGALVLLPIWPTAKRAARWEGALRERGAIRPVDSSPAAGWLPDPTGRHELRYWNGAAWTNHVANRGLQTTDEPDSLSN